MSPAVAVIPHTCDLGGKISLSLVGSIAAYLSASLITALLSISLLRTNFIGRVKLLTILAELIIAQFITSRILRLLRVLPALEKHRGIAVNWCFSMSCTLYYRPRWRCFPGAAADLSASLRHSLHQFVYPYILYQLYCETSRGE